MCPVKELLSQVATEPFFEKVAPWNVAVDLLLAAALSAFLALVYHWTEREAPEKRVFMPSLVLLSMAIAAAMAVIGNDLARAFGLVGAVSIIRFRTSIRDSKDMAFVFFTIVIGMACGLQFRLMALLTTAAASAVVCLLAAIRFGGRGNRRRFLLKVVVRGHGVPLRRIEQILEGAEASWSALEQEVTGKRTIARYLLTLGPGADPPEVLQGLQAAFDAAEVRAALTLRSLEPRR